MPLPGIKARTITTAISTGYENEEFGSFGGFSNWTEIERTGSVSASYYYRDSQSADNSVSSRVVFEIEDSWNITESGASGDNSYIITLTTTLKRVYRDDLRNPELIPPDAGRNIRVWEKKGGRPVINFINDILVMTGERISTPKVLATKNYTLTPGGSVSLPESVYVRNTTPGHDDDVAPSIYLDEFAMGIEFKNDAPVLYRPGRIYIANDPTEGEDGWYSHNRPNGEAFLFKSDSEVKFLFTHNGGVEDSDPPSIYGPSDTKKNMRKIGKNS